MSAPTEKDGDREVFRTNVCPVAHCGKRRVAKIGPNDYEAREVARAWGNKTSVDLRKCMDCGAIWEPWPRGTSVDCVERARELGPCDNCAYRAGSRESLDREERARLTRMARESANVLTVTRNAFACHKGIPILRTTSGIRFAWERTAIDTRNQLCAGWLRLLWDERRRLGLPVGMEEHETLRETFEQARQRAKRAAEEDLRTLSTDLLEVLEEELKEFLDMDRETAVRFFDRLASIQPGEPGLYQYELRFMSASEIIDAIARDVKELDEETAQRYEYQKKLFETAVKIGHFGLRLALLTILA